MTRLSVNINKVATLRNARGENNPDVVKFALHCEEVGAEGITVHPRPDERHIRRSDVRELKKVIATEFNMEGYPSEDFLQLVEENRPAQATLVPDKPDQLTSSSGWDVINNRELLKPIIDRLHKAGVRCSIFVAADPEQVRAAAAIGADRVELYTKPYADLYPQDPEKAIAPFIEAARAAQETGIGLNAGHDLSLENLAYFHKNIPNLDEVSIGHALISDALYLGIDETIRRYLACLDK
ncbi:MAG: pyridoxine 5'-phosphate synthase [Muribaculaceae bacterium]|nr:pyridoxine 5'-phosphate synthase [Muribaculaceae bacterium]